MNDAFQPYTDADLLAAAARVQLPPRLQEPVRVTRGQLWRMNWDGVSVLGAIATDDEHQPVVVPVSFESDPISSARNFPVPGASAHALAFSHQAQPVPAIVLDSLIAELPTPIDAESQKEPQSDPFGTLREFAHVRKLTFLADGAGDLGQVLRSRISPSDLKRTLDVDGTSAMALLRNERPLSPDEATALADTIGIAPDELLRHSAPVPSGLRDVLFLRHFRGAIQQYAQRLGGNETSAWIVSAQRIQTTRYRQTGPGGDWITRAERFFEGEL